MGRAFEALLAVLIAVVALPAAAVSHLPVPAGPTEADEAAFNQQVADATWAASPISATMQRPVVAQLEPLPDGEWDQALFDCLEDAGYPGLGVGYIDGGGLVASTSPANNDVLQPETQLAFYRCVVVHPRDPSSYSSSSLLSDAQIAYRYEHYQRWLMPCLYLNGYAVDDVPNRAKFDELRGQWSPYWWGLRTPNGDWVDTQEEYVAAERSCGSDWPAS